MTDAELKEKLMERFTTANTPMGRWRLGLYVKWKRLAWNLVVGSTRFVKRFLDIVLSVVAIILLMPIFVIIGVLVKMDGGPMIFKQTRIGLRGREFKMYKFRSMCMDAEERLAELLKHNEKKDQKKRMNAFLRRPSM
jgi:lipopolysaccharide/colanic/teichoic acid biosynthesis glycosyltransferase